MNRYEHEFIVECPVNGIKVAYHLVVETPDKIPVEEIISACNVGVGFHEDLADALFARLGGKQIMRAFHHGVWIQTTRGDA